MIAWRQNSAPRGTGFSPALVLVCALVLVGCAAQNRQRKTVERAVSDYYMGDYAAARQKLRPLAQKTDENFVLNNVRLGSAALVDYRLDEAEAAFLRAYEVINAMGVNEGGRSLGAVLVDEKIKIWKGEPYERAMANFDLGLVYYIKGDYLNARGAFENALFKLKDYDDKADKSNPADSNFVPAHLMLGRCWQRIGREDMARVHFQKVEQLRPDLAALADWSLNAQANLLLVVEFGYGPRKVTDFDGSIVGFSPAPQSEPPPPLPAVYVDGRSINLDSFARPTVDLLAMAQDRKWQSIDTIRAIKSALGTGLLAAGAIEGMRGANEHGSAQRRDLTAAAALAAAGLLLKATSQADIRQWEMLPRSIYILPLRLPPGRHDITVRFAGPAGAIHQSWRGLAVPQAGDATYYMRMQRFRQGPYYWPPDEDRPPADAPGRPNPLDQPGH